MPRPKKQHLKRRPDGRYACRYKDQWFYGYTEEEALAAREAYKEAERAGQIPPSAITVAQYAAKWLPVARAAVSPATYRGLATHLDHFAQIIGDTPISEVTPFQIRTVYATKYLGLSQSYILAAKQIIVDLFDSAVENGLCRTNPARSKDAQPHTGTTGSHRAITDLERYWITHLCTDHRCHAAVMAMLYAGLRPQEVKALKVERDVDFKASRITLHEFAHLDPENLQRYEYTETGKTENAARTIPLFAPLREALEGRSGYVITSAHGKQVTIQTWKVAWNSYVSAMETAINGCHQRWYGKTREHKALLAEGKELPPWIPFTVTPYDLRHSFCTWCRDHNVEMNTCIKWMGHADAKMILKIYDTVSEDRFLAQAAKLDPSFAPKDEKVAK